MAQYVTLQNFAEIPRDSRNYLLIFKSSIDILLSKIMSILIAFKKFISSLLHSNFKNSNMYYAKMILKSTNNAGTNFPIEESDLPKTFTN